MRWGLVSLVIGLNVVACSSGGGGGGGPFEPIACPGITPWPDGARTCRTDADCGTNFSEYCAPEVNTGCGACFGPENQCAVDMDCGMGAWCATLPFNDPCNCTGETTERRCLSLCPATPCAADQSCDANGHCVPASCMDGYACPQERVCDPAGVMPDDHGCAYLSCTAGYTCPDGYTCNPGAPGGTPHGCQAISCKDGFVCPANTDCDPTATGHGCIKRSCSNDADCDCGACIQKKCYDKLWICTSPAA